MHGEMNEFAFQSPAFRALPCKAVIDGGIDAGRAHALVWHVGKHIDRVGAIARGKKVKIGLAFQCELIPSSSAIAALEQSEGIDETCTLRRMPAAVEKLLGGGKTHVVVRGTRGHR